MKNKTQSFVVPGRIAYNGLPLAAGPISRCLITKMSVRLGEVKIFYANAPLCPCAKHAKFLQRLHRMMFCPHGGFVRC